MSSLLQRIMIAFGRRGVQAPIGPELQATYRALQAYHQQYPSSFTHAVEILLAEIEGGATALAEVPRRLGHLVQMLDRLHREEDLEAWSEEILITV